MTLATTSIEMAWARAFEPRAVRSAVRIPTTTLLPGGGTVTVEVAPSGGGLFRVSDQCAAREAMLGMGVHRLARNDRKRATQLAEHVGVSFEPDEFYLDAVDADRVPAAAIFVADVSKRWAMHVMERVERLRRADLGDTVQERLDLAFTGRRIHRDAVLAGASSTEHEFDFLVELDRERRAVFDVVSPAPPSLAATHLKFSDLARAHEDWPREAVIADPSAWSGASIALLSQAATHVRPIAADWSDLARLSV